ncbi:hypothetical protein [Halostagnicola sp. A56]|uniref:hypothetical protein n=1 Tax=Halostagnicola sp. A56 TaxID=1495067 RepID=UPI0009E51533|nr:hypothetical protein [Halostagnicola sp. A56]
MFVNQRLDSVAVDGLDVLGRPGNVLACRDHHSFAIVDLDLAGVVGKLELDGSSALGEPSFEHLVYTSPGCREIGIGQPEPIHDFEGFVARLAGLVDDVVVVDKQHWVRVVVVLAVWRLENEREASQPRMHLAPLGGALEVSPVLWVGPTPPIFRRRVRGERQLPVDGHPVVVFESSLREDIAVRFPLKIGVRSILLFIRIRMTAPMNGYLFVLGVVDVVNRSGIVTVQDGFDNAAILIRVSTPNVREDLHGSRIGVVFDIALKLSDDVRHASSPCSSWMPHQGQYCAAAVNGAPSHPTHVCV